LQEEDRVTWGLLKIEMADYHIIHCNLTRQREITTRQSMPAADIDRSIEDMQDRRVKRLDKPQLQIMYNNLTSGDLQLELVTFGRR